MPDLEQCRSEAEEVRKRYFGELRAFVEGLPELVPDTVFLDACEQLAAYRLPDIGPVFHDQVGLLALRILQDGYPAPRSLTSSVAPLAVLEFYDLLKPEVKLIDGSRQVTVRDYEYWRVLGGPLTDSAETFADPQVNNSRRFWQFVVLLARSDECAGPALREVASPEELCSTLRGTLDRARLDLDPPLELMALGNRPLGRTVESYYRRGDLRDASSLMVKLAAVLGKSGQKAHENPHNVIRRVLRRFTTADSEALSSRLEMLSIKPGESAVDLSKARNHYRDVMWRWEYEKLRHPDRFGIDAKPRKPEEAFHWLSQQLTLGEESTIRKVIYAVPAGIFGQD